MSEYRSARARPSKDERRAKARQKARKIRLRHEKKERRKRVLLQGTIALTVVAIIAIIAVVLIDSERPVGPGPRNMASDGIRIGEDFTAVTTPALAAGASPLVPEANAAGVVDIQIALDYLCLVCAEFEATNADFIRTLVESGAATIEYRPIAVLTSRSAGTEYSLRAANAAACVANSAPDSFFEFNERLFADQPDEGTPGLDDSRLIELAAASGAGSAVIEDCVTERTFESWVKIVTDRALKGPLAIRDAEVDRIEAPPAIFVNGQKFEFSYPFNQGEFAQFVLQAAGDEFSTNPTPTPTPTPTR